MKKLLAVLLALAVVGGFAFAQGKVSVGLDGTYTLINQDIQGVATTYDNTYATAFKVTGTTAEGDKGLTLVFTTPSATGPVSYTSYNAWFYMFNKAVKLNFGNYRDSGFRTVFSTGTFDFGREAQQVQLGISVYPVAGLTVQADLAYSATATDVVDILTASNFMASYAIDKIGTVKAWALLGATNAFGGAFQFTGVENLEADVAVNYATNLDFAVYATYALGAFTPYFEFDGTLAGSTFSWEAYVEADYAINDNLSAEADFDYASSNAYAVSACAYWDFLNGVKIGAKAKYDGTDFTWSIPLKYSVAF